MNGVQLSNNWSTEELGSTGKEIERWADESMFVAQRATSLEPEVTLLDAPDDPLGKLAYLAKAYQGKFPLSYEHISDADREYYIQDMEKNILGSPSEAVMFHFVIRNVSRSYTHQLVRTRHASYQQESMRFAVKEDFPVGLPPHLMGTKPKEERALAFCKLMGWSDGTTGMDADFGTMDDDKWATALNTVTKSANEKERLRDLWDDGVEQNRRLYLELVNSGMPAEDARAMVPHGILTQVNMEIDLRSLMQMAGQRLCTQAQWEHKMVWTGIINEIRAFGRKKTYRQIESPKPYVAYSETGDENGDLAYECSSTWQYELLANRFQPICYQTGRCQFRSDFDRYCNIRDRVEANAKIGRPSKEWHNDHNDYAETGVVDPNSGNKEYVNLGIPAIKPTEWLRPDAAIQPTGDWRTAEAKNNIKGRR